MTTASRRRRPCSPAAGQLEGDDVLSECFLRLPPQPSSLARASAVCKRWRRLVVDPGFVRHFRLHHRRNLPLLGFFDRSEGTFVPTLEDPNRVPPWRFSLPSGVVGDCFLCLGCRHGLVLILLRESLQVLVWDPVTGDQHRIALPPRFRVKGTMINGAVLRVAGHVHFQVVLVMLESDGKHRQALACVYSSQTGLWGNIISTPLPYRANGCFYPSLIDRKGAVLAGDSLYWVLAGNSDRILEFDLVKQSLALIREPVDMCGKDSRFTIMRAEGGGLGLILVSKSDCIAQLWKRKTDCGGIASWGLARTIDLEKLLSLKSEEKGGLYIPGIAEENNVVFVWTIVGLFMIHLETLKFKKLFKTMGISYYHPFESVYTAERSIADGHDAADRSAQYI